MLRAYAASPTKPIVPPAGGVRMTQTLQPLFGLYGEPPAGTTAEEYDHVLGQRLRRMALCAAGLGALSAIGLKTYQNSHSAAKAGAAVALAYFACKAGGMFLREVPFWAA